MTERGVGDGSWPERDEAVKNFHENSARSRSDFDSSRDSTLTIFFIAFGVILFLGICATCVRYCVIVNAANRINGPPMMGGPMMMGGGPMTYQGMGNGMPMYPTNTFGAPGQDATYPQQPGGVSSPPGGSYPSHPDYVVTPETTSMSMTASATSTETKNPKY